MNSNLGKLDKSYTLLVDTGDALSGGVGISYHSCNWVDYKTLTIYIGTYDNIAACYVIPASLFNETYAERRIIYTSNTLTISIYQGGVNQILVNVNQTSNYKVRVYGN